MGEGHAFVRRYIKLLRTAISNLQWTELVVSQFSEGKITSDHLASELAGELMLKLPRV
jgi:hypothetical protein